MLNISHKIAKELAVKETQVSAAINLLDEGATVPFVARYRKEVTGGLDDTQLRTLEERLGYLRELEDRLSAQKGKEATMIFSSGLNSYRSSSPRDLTAILMISLSEIPVERFCFLKK